MESFPHSRPVGVLLVALAVLAAIGVPSAAAAPQLSWSTPAPFDLGHVTSAVSCSSESLCVSVDHEGEALSSTDPMASAPSWSSSLVAGAAINAVSCAPEGLCVAVDATGHAIDRSSGASSWSGNSVDGGRDMTGVSCPQAALCVAVDSAGRVLTTANPAGAVWAGTTIDAEHPALKGVSCASATLCAAVDGSGDVLTSANPTGGASAWQTVKVTSEELTAVSCSTAGFCVALDAAGDAFASATPLAGGWTSTAVDAERFNALSCASSGLCVAADGRGEVLASDEPAAAEPVWVAARPSTEALAGVACLPGGSCIAVSTGGRSVSARVPAPLAVTLSPTLVTAEGATAAGVVNPKDATLSSCRFEFGTSTGYGQSAPCASVPTAAGGNQNVSAQLEGLLPNTTYHYRLLVSTPSGTVPGADVTFTTALSSSVPIAQPHPSITGTPAIGQKLTCHANTTPAGITPQFAYAWVNDQIPIAGATGSTYQVRGRDGGHHMQCQVTTTDGGGSASARSAFVTIPMGGVPVSTGETLIGQALASGNRVTLPITCSAQATQGCRISLKLRRGSLTLAALNASVPKGSRRSIALELSTRGKRVLAAHRHLSATLQISGTVIGVIEGQLGTQTLSLTAPPKSTSRTIHHAARRAAVRSRRVAGAGTAAAHVLSATPYMGWDTYLALGGRITEANVLRQASQVKSLGLEHSGYRYIWLDVGWWHGARLANGEISVSPTQWPHGLPWLTRTLHAAGFLVGLYTDAGPDGCGGAGQGSFGHYQQDADSFAAWGFDAVKVDFCGGSERSLDPATAYTAFHQAIANNSSRRPMLLSICDFLQPEQQGEGLPPLLAQSAFGSFAFGPSVGNSWRTDTDIGTPGNVKFTGVLRNLDADAANPQAAGPGHWNDPDYLAPGQGMSSAQFRTQLSMWAMLAAPLMLSADLTKINSTSLSYLENQELLAVDQDPAGVQGTLVSSSGNGEVWVKPLADGSRAVALLNRGAGALRISTTAAAVGMASAPSYSWRDLFTHRNIAGSRSISVTVPADGTILLRVR